MRDGSLSLREILDGAGDNRPIQKVLEELVETEYPHFLKMFYPRMYENLGGYHSPKVAGLFLSNIAADLQKVPLTEAPNCYRMIAPSFHYLLEHRVPTMFLAPDFLEAVKRTDFLDDIEWSTLPLPYESGVFILPRGAVKHPKDGDVAFIFYSRDRKGSTPNVPGVVGPIELPRDGFSFVALCPENDDPVWYDSHFSPIRPYVKLRNMFYRSEGEPTPKLPNLTFLDEDLEEGDAPFLEELGVIVFGTFLALNARPSLMTRASRISSSSKKNRAREFWSPNIIGRDYRLPRQAPSTGTHASPRMHWRRGHFRMQACGHQRQERKQIWIDPMLIAAPTTPDTSGSPRSSNP